MTHGWHKAARATAAVGFMLTLLWLADGIGAWAGQWLSLPVLALACCLLFVAGAALALVFRGRALGPGAGNVGRVGGYRLVERIATGGMGEVWRAHHVALDRVAAIKMIRPQLLAGKSSAQIELIQLAFAREAQSMACLSSPHAMQLYDSGCGPGGIAYYAMELLGGMSLSELINRFGPLPPERAIHILGQVCQCLDDAHQRGIVHCDIKPGNIQLTTRGGVHDFVKVFDFGLVDRAGVARSWPVRAMLGTPGYAAPEAITGYCRIDWRADLYSLGCVAYTLLTGTPVFDSDSRAEVLRAHLEDLPIPPSMRANRELPPALDRLVIDLLAKEPEARPWSAAEVARRLEEIPQEPAWTRERARRWWRTHAPREVEKVLRGDCVAIPAPAESATRRIEGAHEASTVPEAAELAVRSEAPRLSLPFTLCRVRSRG